MRQVVRKRLALVVAMLSTAFVAPVTAAGVAATCAGAADGDTVAIVIDYGDVTDQGARPGGVETYCVPWHSGMRGGEAMRAAGLPLRFAPSGLLCAINGYPADGCGDRTGQQYYYWSYWKAGAGETSWGYSTTGAATAIRANVTEGWRFVKGAGSPNDPQPRSAPDHDAICPDAAVPPAVDPPAPPSADPGAQPSTGAPAASTTVPSSDLAVGEPGDASTSVPEANPSTTVTPSDDGAQVALADATPTSSSRDVGGVIGVIVVVVLIAGLGAAALLRARRPADG